MKSTSSRSYSEIIRSNIFNAINIILFSIGAVMIAIGRASDAVTSVGLIVMNIIIGIVQEIRAKRQLDHIALLTRPKVRVIRDQQEKEIDPAELVQGDMISLAACDQIVVDGLVTGDGIMQVDESLLTGESDLVKKTAGDEVLSGSFCVSGAGHYQATKVGEDIFANRLITSARKFQMSITPPSARDQPDPAPADDPRDLSRFVDVDRHDSVAHPADAADPDGSRYCRSRTEWVVLYGHPGLCDGSTADCAERCVGTAGQCRRVIEPRHGAVYR
ncbi:MAG: hypothetical protein K8J31_30125 [Anaerolineae bacterium]|nr:hypothetical protein [Anaerolineae bacterium]